LVTAISILKEPSVTIVLQTSVNMTRMENLQFVTLQN